MHLPTSKKKLYKRWIAAELFLVFSKFSEFVVLPIKSSSCFTKISIVKQNLAVIPNIPPYV